MSLNLTIMLLNSIPGFEWLLWERRLRRDEGVAPTHFLTTFKVKN